MPERLIILFSLVSLIGYLTFGLEFLYTRSYYFDLSPKGVEILYLTTLVGYTTTIIITIHDRIFRCE